MRRVTNPPGYNGRRILRNLRRDCAGTGATDKEIRRYYRIIASVAWKLNQVGPGKGFTFQWEISDPANIYFYWDMEQGRHNFVLTPQQPRTYQNELIDLILPYINNDLL